MSVGRNIKALRENKGITQGELAKSAEITQAMLCQIERETKNPSLQVSKRIADILESSLDELLTEK